MAGTRHGEVFRLELSPSILELCDRAATKVVWVTVSVAARSGDIGNNSHWKKIPVILFQRAVAAGRAGPADGVRGEPGPGAAGRGHAGRLARQVSCGWWRAVT